jgi:hypothetical protein
MKLKQEEAQLTDSMKCSSGVSAGEMGAARVVL